MPLEQALNRLRDAPTFSRTVANVNALIEAPLAGYVQRLSVTRARGTKAVKDAVWGMIDLEDREVLVLDSPPMQRLRRIRQLGLGYLTYPTAGYSRFEHSLGAVQQADRMIRAVASRTGRRLTAGGESKWTGEGEVLAAKPVVRLAALLHDIGHLPLSHVSERFYDAAECPDPRLVSEARDLRDEVHQHLGGKKPSLSEALSVATVLAPAFWSFLVDEARYERSDAAAAVAAIVGRAPSPREAFVYQLITNVIDADKLDYMFRDGYLTGVPLAVDLDRLLFKLKCVELPYTSMPPELHEIASTDESAWVLGIDLVGQRLAYDVTVARTMLFERVYLHHKTRAAERVAMARLQELMLPAAELLRFDDSLFLAPEPRGSARATRLTAMLSERQLPVRAYALSYNFLPRTPVGERDSEPQVIAEAETGWSRLGRDLSVAERRQALEQRILRAARGMAKLVAPETVITDVWVDTRPPRGDVGTWDLWVETPDGELAVARTTDARSAAYAHSPAHAFFIYGSGSGDVSQITFLGSELVLARRYGLMLGRDAADYAKVSFREVEALKRRLEEEAPEIYSAVGRLRPEPLILRQQRTADRIAALAEKFHHYHGQADARVGAGRIREFLRQFPEAQAEEMLDVLEDLRFLDRSDLGQDFATFLEEGADESEQFVVLTRRADKSGAHLPYFLADREAGINVVPLATALARSGPITFFDDVVISGFQPRTAVQTWLGLEPELPEESGELADPLTDRAVDSLRTRRVRFRFAYGHQPGLDALAQLTGEQGLGEDVAARQVEPRDKPLKEVGRASDDLVEFLAGVGEDLLLSTKATARPDKWTPERCGEFALGYGDLQQLVVMLYNTPTGTVTALWKGGRFNGAPWLPLFPRRGEPVVTRID